MKNHKIKQFLKLALAQADILSKDPSTKVGALFIDRQDYTTLSSGFNGMPRGVDESKAYRWERPLKYSFLEHAERNGIYNLARHHYLKGSAAVCSETLSISCIRAFLSVGVSSVYLTKEISEEIFYIASELFNESGVKLITVEQLPDLTKDLTPFKELLLDLKQNPCEQCVFVDNIENLQIISKAVKRVPPLFEKNTELLEQFPLYSQESAVRMAIFELVKPLFKDTALIVTATTCIECARACVLSGVKEIHYMEPNEDFMSRWGDSVMAAVNFCKLAGLEVKGWEGSEIDKKE